MQLISHRWLDPLNHNFHYAESSKEAFENLLDRWYWLEFDINFSKDLIPFVFHDQGLTRISQWKDERTFNNLSWNEIMNISLPNHCHFITLNALFSLIKKRQKIWLKSALHLKSSFQEKKMLDILISTLLQYQNINEKIFLFDVKIDTATYLKKNLPEIELFVSVAHAYDEKRFNNSVWGTLYTIEEAIANKDLIDWVRLDEWDRKDIVWTKKLYTEEVINSFKNAWLKTAIISPELHAKSPWLLWGESHEDVESKEKLQWRIKDVKVLNPDFVCTDYLDYYW